jgi:hypothetical protein
VLPDHQNQIIRACSSKLSTHTTQRRSLPEVNTLEEGREGKVLLLLRVSAYRCTVPDRRKLAIDTQAAMRYERLPSGQYSFPAFNPHVAGCE